MKKYFAFDVIKLFIAFIIVRQFQSLLYKIFKAFQKLLTGKLVPLEFYKAFLSSLSKRFEVCTQRMPWERRRLCFERELNWYWIDDEFAMTMTRTSHEKLSRTVMKIETANLSRAWLIFRLQTLSRWNKPNIRLKKFIIWRWLNWKTHDFTYKNFVNFSNSTSFIRLDKKAYWIKPLMPLRVCFVDRTSYDLLERLIR